MDANVLIWSLTAFTAGSALAWLLSARRATMELQLVQSHADQQLREKDVELATSRRHGFRDGERLARLEERLADRTTELRALEAELADARSAADVTPSPAPPATGTSAPSPTR